MLIKNYNKYLKKARSVISLCHQKKEPIHKINSKQMIFKITIISKNMKVQNHYLWIEVQESHSNFCKKVQINRMKSKEIN